MNLLEFLKKSPVSRKIFGIREIKIIEKQLNGVNLTQSEKNRLSRDIRKKLDIINELSRFSDEFDLKKGAYIKEIIDDTKEIILEDIESRNIRRVFLFGSVLEKSLSISSDIDIAVEMKNTDKKKATLFRKRIMGKTNERVDVQVFNILPEKIKKEIKKGKIIYEK